MPRKQPLPLSKICSSLHLLDDSSLLPPHQTASTSTYFCEASFRGSSGVPDPPQSEREAEAGGVMGRCGYRHRHTRTPAPYCSRKQWMSDSCSAVFAAVASVLCWLGVCWLPAPGHHWPHSELAAPGSLPAHSMGRTREPLSALKALLIHPRAV